MIRVLLLCTEPWLGLKVVYCLRAAGYQVDVIANRSMVFRSSRYVRKFTVVPFPTSDTPTPEFTGAVRAYVEDNSIQCVMGDHTGTQILINEMGAGLGRVARFPGMPTSDIKAFNDKWIFNQLLLKRGLPGTPSRLLRTIDDAQDPEILSLGFPMTVKPLTGEGGMGVVRIDGAAALSAHVTQELLPLIAQRFLPGHDAGLSFLAVEGKILGQTLQRYHLDDLAIEFFRNDAIEELGREFARLTKYTGLANLDLRIDDDYRLLGIIECNPRFWGSIVASRVHGINFVKAGVDLALGAEPEALKVGDYRTGRYYTARALVKKWISNRGSLTGIRLENLREVYAQTFDIGPYLRRIFEGIHSGDPI
jgi:carbamoylphosphate synthase large subunit